MTRDERWALDIWAMTHLDMDSDDVDEALRIAGLDARECSAGDARMACMEYRSTTPPAQMVV